ALAPQTSVPGRAARPGTVKALTRAAPPIRGGPRRAGAVRPAPVPGEHTEQRPRGDSPLRHGVALLAGTGGVSASGDGGHDAGAVDLPDPVAVEDVEAAVAPSQPGRESQLSRGGRTGVAQPRRVVRCGGLAGEVGDRSRRV